ncbi:hypothetical protein RQP46_003292 [Phenoliferia psychrophenolica]
MLSSFILAAALVVAPAIAVDRSAARRDSGHATHSGMIRRTAMAKRSLPFSHIVAFGDDLSDNGQGLLRRKSHAGEHADVSNLGGSYRHGITGDPKTLWGFGTWTDGHVSVTKLAQLLGLPLSYDYAFGSSGGGEKIGSVCDNSLIPSSQTGSYAQLDGAIVPSAIEQIKNYTSGPLAKEASSALHVLWTGNNDVIASLGWSGRFTICDKDTLCHPGQQTFIDEFTKSLMTALKSLVSSGAKYILVPNVYPRQLSPWTSMWISSEAGLISDFGHAIDNLNAAVLSNITALNKELGSNILSYDVNKWMTAAISNPSMSGVNTTGSPNGSPNTCVDGCSNQDAWNVHWAATVLDKKPSNFFWMTEVMPSSTVLRHLAHSMYSFVASKY